MAKTKFIEFSGLGRQFSHHWAVKNATGVIYSDTNYAFIGPNGAGKSTLLFLLSRIYRAATGHIEYKQGIQVELLSHLPMVYSRLSGYENMKLALVERSRENAVAGKSKEAEVEKLLELTGLKKARHKTAAAYSRGMLQRLSLARALLTRPDVLFLDEPYSGLDVDGQSLVNTLIKTKTLPGYDFKISSIVFVDHDLDRAKQFSDEMLLIDGGEIKQQNKTAAFDLKKIKKEVFKVA